jgi:hypothetical protein
MDVREKIRGLKVFAVCVLHIPVRGVAAAFRSRSVAACVFHIRTPDGSAFLCSMRCTMAIVFRFVLPEGLTCRVCVSPGRLARSVLCVVAGRLHLYLIYSIDKIASDQVLWRELGPIRAETTRAYRF